MNPGCPWTIWATKACLQWKTRFTLQRLDGGLFTLQTVDYILAWVMVEDDGVNCTSSL
jgi:hypothetical protein